MLVFYQIGMPKKRILFGDGNLVYRYTYTIQIPNIINHVIVHNSNFQILLQYHDISKLSDIKLQNNHVHYLNKLYFLKTNSE